MRNTVQRSEYVWNTFVYEMSITMKFPVSEMHKYEMSCQWKFLSMKFPICEMLAVYIYIQKKFETCGDWPFFPTTYKWYTIGFLHTNYNFNRWYKICVYLSLYVMFFFQKRKKCPSQWSELHNSLERAGKRHE